MPARALRYLSVVDESQGVLRGEGGSNEEGPDVLRARDESGIRSVRGGEGASEGTLPERTVHPLIPTVGEVMDAVGEYASLAALWDIRAANGGDTVEVERMARAAYRHILNLVYTLSHGRRISW